MEPGEIVTYKCPAGTFNKADPRKQVRMEYRCQAGANENDWKYIDMETGLEADFDSVTWPECQASRKCFYTNIQCSYFPLIDRFFSPVVFPAVSDCTVPAEDERPPAEAGFLKKYETCKSRESGKKKRNLSLLPT